MGRTGYKYEFSCTLIEERERAYLVDAGDGELWLPKSAIMDEERRADGSLVLTISAALAEEKGLV